MNSIVDLSSYNHPDTNIDSLLKHYFNVSNYRKGAYGKH